MTLAIVKSRGMDVKAYKGRLGRPLMSIGEEAPGGNYRQHSLYVGWVTCLFALVGLVSMFFSGGLDDKRLFDKRITIVFFTVAAVIFWIFSMGRYVECIYRFVFALPFGDYLRAPVKWHHLTEFCIVVLAAFGLGFAWSLVSRYGVYARMALIAIVVYGACDLAREAKKYCAPHTADTNVGPLPQPMPVSHPEREAFLKEVRKYGLNPIATMNSPFRMRDGSIKNLDVLVVEQKSTRPIPSKRDYDNELKGLPVVAAIGSLALTILLLLYLFLTTAVKRVDRIKI
jgi:hypothetical protein